MEKMTINMENICTLFNQKKNNISNNKLLGLSTYPDTRLMQIITVENKLSEVKKKKV